jgi:hypothetical protein
MPTITVGHHPELTLETAMEVFKKHFSGKYEVYKPGHRRGFFIVKKSTWAGVRVAPQQKKDSTSIIFNAWIPSDLLNALFLGLIAWLVLRPGWKRLEKEIESFIKNAPEFK